MPQEKLLLTQAGVLTLKSYAQQDAVRDNVRGVALNELLGYPEMPLQKL